MLHLLYAYMLCSTVEEKERNREKGRRKKKKEEGKKKRSFYWDLAFIIFISKVDDSNISFLFSNR